MNSIFKRRSIRSYDDRSVSDQSIESILAAAMQAPSACNSQPWEFLVITDKDKLKSISQIHAHAKMCAQASAAILVIANPSAQSGISEGFFPQDCAAATQNILLEATELGIGSVWCGIYPKENMVLAFREFFNLPSGIIPFSLVVLGYPQSEPAPSSRFDPARVHFNKY